MTQPCCIPQTEVVYRTAEGVIELSHVGSDRYRLDLIPAGEDQYIPRPSCETTFPPVLIQFIAQRSSFAWICEIIARHEDPSYMSKVLLTQLFSYFPVSRFGGCRLLDFGCGSGASTFALAQTLPGTNVVGVELERSSVEIAGRIADHRKLSNIRFLRSPSPEALPAGIGQFDFVMLSAVYEHLLPAERRILMRLLWGALKPGGALFINQTPHRYFPYEHHSTMLWFINYMPDRIAHQFARRYARHNPGLNRSGTWSDLLRGGIRGGTEREIIRNLSPRGSADAIILQPRERGLHDRADYWLAGTNPDRMRRVKKALASFFRVSDRLWAAIPSMNIDVVIQKPGPAVAEAARAPSRENGGRSRQLVDASRCAFL